MSLFAPPPSPMLLDEQPCTISEWCAVNSDKAGGCCIPMALVRGFEPEPLRLPDWESRAWARALLERGE